MACSGDLYWFTMSRCLTSVLLSRLKHSDSFAVPRLKTQANGDANECCHDQTELEGQTSCQHCNDPRCYCCCQSCPIFEHRDDQGDKGEWQRKVQGPAGGNLSSEYDANSSARLPCTP